MKKKLCLLLSVLALSTAGLAACGGTEQSGVKRYNVTFSVAGEKNVSLWIDHGQTIDQSLIPTLPAANTGYDYVWDYDFTAPVTGNLSIKAIEKAKTYTVTFDCKGGTQLEETSMTVTYDQEYTLPTPNDGRYCEFQYWLDEDGKTFASTGTWKIDGDVTLSAYWIWWTPTV